MSAFGIRSGTESAQARSHAPPSAGGPDVLRAAFRNHAAGVAVVTAADRDGRPAGFTATSVASVAADPPMLSFGIGTTSSTWPVIAGTGHVGVHILAEDQCELAATFARSGADRFAPPTLWREGPASVPVLDGVLAWMVCRVAALVPAGDHRLVLAEVTHGEAADSGRPLLYQRGRFHALRD